MSQVGIESRSSGALARFATRPEVELFELLLRDVVDVALGNTDNHARNTAVLEVEGGPIELTPLYDFAPMVLDPSCIARVCRWRTEEEGVPSHVVDAMEGRIARTARSLEEIE